MIKKIYLKKTSTLQNESIEIDFSENVNVIIGPKGGGKSTLFHLLIGLKSNYISRSVIDALKSFNFEFEKAVTFSNEEILLNSLNKKAKKDMENNFKSRNDVIYQDDIIKKDINSFPQIEKQKLNFIKESLYQDKAIMNLIDELRRFYNYIESVCQLRNTNNINWSNLFKIKDLSNNDNLIIKLNYSNDDIKLKIKEELSVIKNTIDNSIEQERIFKNYLNKSFNQIYLNEIFNKNYNDNVKNIILNLDLFITTLKLKEKELNRILMLSNIFNDVYKKKIEQIKQKEFSETIKYFIEQARYFFKANAKHGYNFKILFKEFIKDEFILKIENYKKEYGLLTYKIESNIVLNENELFSILSPSLHIPRSKNDVYKWIDENNKKGMQEFSDDKIIDEISSILKDKVIVLADNLDYNKMSFGQKSIYGIKYKFNHSLKEDLFLDQPEDNLDNYTIATNILDLIQQKKDNQVFIVTHNANIGILTKPGKVILADLNNKDSPYTNTGIETIKSESMSAHYLEGGLKFLEERYKIIKGN